MNARLRRPAVALLATTLTASVLGFAPAAYAADGTLSGTVTGSESGNGLPGVDVEIYQYNTIDKYWEAIEYASTEVDGTYSVPLPEGDYRVGFSDNYNAHIAEYYANVDDVDNGTTVPVSSGTPAVVNAELDPGAHVAGTVTGPGTAGLSGILVTAYRPVEEDGYVYYDWAGSTFTNPDGTYDIGGLATGSGYHVKFSDDDYAFDKVTSYATEYYNDVTTQVEAAAVAVTAPQTTPGVNAELAPDAEFSGRVTDSTGAAIEDAWVDALIKVGDEWEYTESAYTGADGTYVLDGLRAGTYRVEIGGVVGGQYTYEYWNDKGRIENGDDVVVSADAPRTGIDATLVPGSHDSDYTVTNLAVPTVSGAAVVGSTLTASTGSWTPTPTEYYYDWLRDGQFIDGAYGSTYVPTAADIGKKITVLVSAGADGYDYGYAESAPTAAVVAAPVPPAPTPVTPAPVPPAPVVDVPAGLAAIVANLDTSGKPKVGKTVKVSGLDTLLRTTVSYKFTWFAGTKKIAKATKSKLKITKAMKGKKISVKVTATAASTSKSVKLKFGKVK
jgi:5-hydroxyisourate hydrolase-like protein (transthyretin family)